MPMRFLCVPITHIFFLLRTDNIAPTNIHNQGDEDIVCRTDENLYMYTQYQIFYCNKNTILPLQFPFIANFKLNRTYKFMNIPNDTIKPRDKIIKQLHSALYQTSHTMRKYEPRHEKTKVLVSDLVRHKPGCTATEDG